MLPAACRRVRPKHADRLVQTIRDTRSKPIGKAVSKRLICINSGRKLLGEQ